MTFNRIKTARLLASMSGLLLLLGRFIGGNAGLTFALIFSLVLNYVTYFYSDKLVLKMYKAVPLDKQKYADLYDVVDELSHEQNIPMPKLWYVPSKMANAFATGRNPKNASVVVTQGILDILDESELRGVLAHEMAHIKNRDILVGTIAATLATAIGYMAFMLRWSAIFGGRGNGRDRGGVIGTILVAILMPIAATLIQLAISRSREYLADDTGAKTCRDPLALASALEKLSHSATEQRLEPQSPGHASIASLFIVYPFRGKGLTSLFSTHPPMEKRIARLRKMADRY